MYICAVTDGSACEVFEDSHLHHAIQLGQQRQCGPHGRVPGLIDIRHCSTGNAATAAATVLLFGSSALVWRMQLALIGFQNIRVRQVTIHTYIHTYMLLYIHILHTYTTYIYYIHTYIHTAIQHINGCEHYYIN